MAQNTKCKSQSSSPGFMLTGRFTFGQRVLGNYYSHGHGEYSVINGCFSILLAEWQEVTKDLGSLGFESTIGLLNLLYITLKFIVTAIRCKKDFKIKIVLREMYQMYLHFKSKSGL